MTEIDREKYELINKIFQAVREGRDEDAEDFILKMYELGYKHGDEDAHEFANL